MSPSPCPAENKAAEIAPRWSFARRVVFRFVCCYWLLYGLPSGPGRVNIVNIVPGAFYVTRYWVNLWRAIVPWVAIHVFSVTGRAATYFQTGSGDTTLAYVANLLFVVVALAAALVWSVLDRRRSNYRALEGWLRLFVRYTLAFTLFSYGFAKIFPLQFGPPFPNKLIEPWGEFSPMGALWSFMGASIPYVIFSGAAEAAGGLLLLFRRTATLGALVAFGVLANVVALNFCYDVPVKLYSTNLLLMAVYLASADLRRLANVLVLNRPAAPAEFTEPVFQRRNLRIAATAFWVLFVGYTLYNHISGGWQGYQSRYVKVRHPPLYGVYDVESGPAEWKKVVVSFAAGMQVRTRDDQTRAFASAYEGDTVILNKRDKLTISRPDPDHLVLEGQLFGSPATIRLKRLDDSKFLLLSRGFHWINEMPFNR